VIARQYGGSLAGTPRPWSKGAGHGRGPPPLPGRLAWRASARCL